MALINDPSLDKMIATMGIDSFISPKSITVSSILRNIRHGMVRSVYSIGDGEAEVLEFRVLESSPIAGKTLKDVDWPKDSLAGLLKKDTEVLVPRGNTKFEKGDVLTVFCLRDDIGKVENLFHVGVDFFIKSVNLTIFNRAAENGIIAIKPSRYVSQLCQKE